MRATIPKRMLSLFLSLCLVTGFLPILPSTALAVDREDGTVSAKIYTGQGDYGEFTGETDTVSVDQSGLILDLRGFNATLPSGAEVESLAFYPENAGSNEWGTVFWFNGNEEHPCDNGTPNDKLFVDGQYNGVFQLLDFTPNGSNGSAGLTPGTYKVLAYVGNGQTGDAYKELYYLSNETFTITEAAGPGKPVINTTTLPTAYAGESYSQILQATPGTTGNTLTWSITSGSLPAGLQLDASTGVLSGTPTEAAAGNYTFTVQVSETAGDETLTATKVLTLEVAEKLVITNNETNFSLKRNDAFSLPLTANLEGVTWKIISGMPPSSLRLNGNVISGTVSDTAREGDYQVTVQASAGSQTTTKDFTFTIDEKFAFTLPAELDPDAFGHFAYLYATLDNGEQVTLWSGTLTGVDQKLPVYASYAGKMVKNVRLVASLNASEFGKVNLATLDDTTALTDGNTATLTSKGNVVVSLPTFEYGELGDYVGASYRDQSGYHYNAGDLAKTGETFALNAGANISRYLNDGKSSFDLNGTPTFSGEGVTEADDSYTYTSSSGGGTITVSYPLLNKETVTFTLQPAEGQQKGNLEGAKLSFQQTVNGEYVQTTAEIATDNTATAELYTGREATVVLLEATGYGLKNTEIEQVQESNTLIYSTLGYTGAALIITPKLVEDASENLQTYAENLTNSSLCPAITIQDGSKKISWTGGSLNNVMQGIGKPLRSGIWSYWNADTIESLVKSGDTYSLSWRARGGLLAGNVEETQTWPKGQLSASVEAPIHLKGGVLLKVNNTMSGSFSVQDWWYCLDEKGTGTWISGNMSYLYAGERNYSFYCPGNNGTYNFLLLPRGVRPTTMTWNEAKTSFESMPLLEGVGVKDDAVTTGTFEVSEEGTVSSRYLTLPNSTLSGPDQFSSTSEVLSFTGSVKLDEGVDGKLKTLRIDAAGTDSSGRVAFQISSLQINGQSYNYAGIHIQDKEFPNDTLMSEQFETYYEITFSEPISLPCTFTVYGKAMTSNSDVQLVPSVKLEGVTGATATSPYDWQPLGTVTAKAPALSVFIPASAGTDSITAYLTIPEGSGMVDIYDGETLVVPGAWAGEVRIPLAGTSSSLTTSHNLSFRWQGETSDASTAPYEVTVSHTNGLPTLVRQSLQVGEQRSTSTIWTTYSRDRMYSFTSAEPPAFRAVCTIDNSENILNGKDGVTFLFHLLNGTTVSRGAASQTEDTFTSGELNTNSPVIGTSVRFEVDWSKVNQVIEEHTPSVPSDSPTATGYTFDQTIVMGYDDYKDVLLQETPENAFTEDDQAAIRSQIGDFQRDVERAYEQNRGDAGYYTIIDDGSDFYTGRYMIEQLDSGVLPEGYTGETTFTRPLTQEQLQGELGGGDGWTRLTFVEPGEEGGWGGTGEGGETGAEIYATEFTTDSGVTGTITIARTGTGEDARIIETGTAIAQGTGTGGGEPDPLPSSGTINPDAGGGNPFSFTVFGGPDGMEVFTNWCDDTGAVAGIIGSFAEAYTGHEPNAAWKMLGGVGNILGAGKSAYDGITNSMTLSELHTSTLELLSSRCAQKLPANVYNSLQSQIDYFSDMAIEAMGWNAAVTLGGTGTGLAGAAGIMSNPWTALTAGIAQLGAGLINRQQNDNVRKEAQLIRDNVQFQITKNALATNDPECMQDKDATYRVCIDPSGVVYEAVLSNPVEGATVTLYTDGTDYTPEYTKDKDTGLEIYVDEDGKPVAPSNAREATGATLTAPKTGTTIPEELALTTGTDGRYQWMVPQGLWFVTAQKDGYEPGNSENDVAAVVTTDSTDSGTSTIKWLPVSPEQTNVNIPLVSYEPPTVTVEAREDGVYLAFSKYMDESTLMASNFKLTDGKGEAITVSAVELLNSEQAPANIDYGENEAPSYTSQVKLAVAEGTTLSDKVIVSIDEDVASYAGVPCANNAVEGIVREGALVYAPELNGQSGKVEYGTEVTLSIPDGAAVYYTTDGSEPNATNGTRYYEGQPITITESMTLKAVAVKYGQLSKVTSAKFTVSGGEEPTPPDPGPTPGGSGGGGAAAYGVAVADCEHGKISAEPAKAAKGDTVTVTVTPEEGFEVRAVNVTDAGGKAVEVSRNADGTFSFVMPAGNVTVSAVLGCDGGALCPSAGLTDVDQSQWYHDAVDWAVSTGVMTGFGNGLFGPDVDLTRAQMAQILWNVEGRPAVDYPIAFGDVSGEDWFHGAVAWAASEGIFEGYGAGSGLFGPEDALTREQAAAVLMRWAAFRGEDTSARADLSAYPDADDVSEWAVECMSWAVAQGVIAGVGLPDGTLELDPLGTASRAQTATLMMRLVG